MDQGSEGAADSGDRSQGVKGSLVFSLHLEVADRGPRAGDGPPRLIPLPAQHAKTQLMALPSLTWGAVVPRTWLPGASHGDSQALGTPHDLPLADSPYPT